MRLSCIAVIDRSQTFAEARRAVLERIVRAVQVQVECDFGPAWGKAPLPVLLVSDGSPVPLGAALVYLTDRVEGPAGAVATHGADPRGFFTGQVAVGPIAKLGGTMTTGSNSISAALSHEVLELLANPALNLWADAPDGLSYAQEVCDPVSGDSYAIEVEPYSEGPAEPVSVSNFVHPAWFSPVAQPGEWFDQMQLLKAPFEVRPTGYAVSRKPANAEAKLAVDADGATAERAARLGRIGRAPAA